MDPQFHPKIKSPIFFLSQEQHFNSQMVNVMAKVLGAVGFIWFCILLDIGGFAGLIYQTIQSINTHTNLLITIELWVTFIAQSVIQLVALPVLQNYQNRQSAMQEAKAQADHLALTHIALQMDKIVDGFASNKTKGV